MPTTNRPFRDNVKPLRYRTIKRGISIEQVLRFYGYSTRNTVTGHGLLAYYLCPIDHLCALFAGNTGNTGIFQVDFEQDTFLCKGHCGNHGDTIDLVAAIEECNRREAADLIQAWFQLTTKSVARRNKHNSNACNQLPELLGREQLLTPAALRIERGIYMRAFTPPFSDVRQRQRCTVYGPGYDFERDTEHFAFIDSGGINKGILVIDPVRNFYDVEDDESRTWQLVASK